MIWLLAACSQTGDPQQHAYLAVVNQAGISVAQFKKAFEDLSLGMSTHESGSAPDMKSIKLRVLSQLIEEAVILERARELKLSVSEADVEDAVAAIKADYPAGEFEKMLLEQAVSYQQWRRQLKTRLLKEKVVELELMANIDISSQDIADYYRQHAEDLESEYQQAGSTEQLNRQVFKQVRRHKAEAAYHPWMAALMKRYSVEINQKLWARTLAD